jgi:hypothetical protein
MRPADIGDQDKDARFDFHGFRRQVVKQRLSAGK